MILHQRLKVKYLNNFIWLLTLSGLAFSVVRQARGGGLRGPEAQMPKIKVNITLIEIKFCMGHYVYKSILDAKFEVDSPFSLEI